MASDGPANAPSGSYRGQDLADADFSDQDLRGVDFTAANLRSANFRQAKIGVTPGVGAALLGVSLLVAVAAGVAIGWSVNEMRMRFTSDEWDQVAGGVSLALTVLVLLTLFLWKGVDFAFKTIGVLYAVVVAINIVANLIWDELEWLVLVRATVLILFVVLAIIVGMVGGVFGLWSVILVAVLGGLATGQSEGGITGVIVAVSLATISKQAVRGDPRHRSLRRIGHNMIRRWGTQFVNADLTGADFTGTDPSRCDARGAILDHVIWDPGHPLPVDIPTVPQRR